MRFWAWLSGCLVALLWGGCLPARAGAAPVPHTPFVATPPDGWAVAPGWLGPVSPSTDADRGVTLSLLPMDFSQSLGGFLPQTIEQNGWVRFATVSHSVPLTDASATGPPTRQGLLVQARQPGRGAVRLLLLAPWGDTHTVLAQAVVKNGEAGAVAQAETMLKTLSLNPQGWFSPFLAQDWGFGEPPGLRPARAGGEAIVYTATGRFPAPGAALWLATREPARPFAASLADTARARLISLAGYRNHRQHAAAALTVAGHAAAWASALATQTPQGQEVFLWVGLVATPTDFFLTVGECPVAQAGPCGEGFVGTLKGFWRTQTFRDADQ